MEPLPNQSPLIVIVGQTASGKTALAIELARRFDGEIIAADSRTVYRGMDIGTAKPTPEEQRAVPHHLIDIVEPDVSFNVASFQRCATQAIEDIASRHHLPLLVGGTGLYIDAVIYNFSFRNPPDPAYRELLQTKSVDTLQSLLVERGIPLPENRQNPRHLIRALETGGAASIKSGLRPRTLVLGLALERDLLEKRIRLRVEKMVEQGFVEEVRRLTGRYGWDVPALQAPGYKAFRLFFQNELTLEQAMEEFVRNDMQYAKRQKTWFKRDPNVLWISKTEEAVDLVTTFLNK